MTPPSAFHAAAFDALVVLLVSLTPAAAQTLPERIGFQGRLTDAGGVPVTGTVDMTFKLYTEPTGGTPVWTQGPVPVVISGGLYGIELGTTPFDGLEFDEPYCLEVLVDGVELLPRYPLLASPYAMRAKTAGSLDGILDPAHGGLGFDASGAATGSLLAASGVGAWSALSPGTNGQVLKVISGQPAWGTDDAGPGGTVTQIDAGTGITLSPSPITSSGSIAFDTTYGDGRYLTLASDQEVTGAKTFSNGLNVFAGDGSALAGLWRLGGNAITDTATQFLGTANNLPLEIRVNNLRAARVEPGTTSPNWIGGHSSNSASAGVNGAFIGGGGSTSYVNVVNGTNGVVCGGMGNAVASHSFAGSGANNAITGTYSVIVGGNYNTCSSNWSVLVGGSRNTCSGSPAPNQTIGGGTWNTTSASDATIAGGTYNKSVYRAAVGGGYYNEALGSYSTIPGGDHCKANGDYSLAAGRRAVVDAAHDGALLLADMNNFDFASAAANEFAVRATGGVRLVTAVNETGLPTATLSVNAAGDVSATGTGAFAGTVSGTDPTDDAHFVTRGYAGATYAPASGGDYVAKAGDTMTGALVLPADGLAAGSGQLTLASGRVGIGTSTPSELLDVDGNGHFTGTVTADGGFVGSGSLLTSLGAANLTGTILDGCLAGTYTGVLSFNNASNVFIGSGAGLTSLNASNLATGTVANGRLATSYAQAISFGNITSATITTATIAGGTIAGSGSGLTSLNASQLTTGTVPAGRLSGTYGINVSGNAASASSVVGGTVDDSPVGATTPSAGTFTDLTVADKGKLYLPAGGGSPLAGTATLSSGAVTVDTAAVSGTSVILVSRNQLGSRPGHLYLGTITPDKSFVIRSSDSGDDGTVNWLIVN